MHHPSESDLALYAGNDLGRFARMRIDWHLRTCSKCQQDVTEFSSLRVDLMRSAPEPEVNWNRLAAEMKANIRLGLEAGECIATAPVPRRLSVRWVWATAATAALIAIAAGGEFWINHPWSLNSAGNAPATMTASLTQDIILEVGDSGIQMRSGDSVTNELRNNNRGENRGEVVYSVNAQGGVGASYVDKETGMVTVNNIYYGQ
jgi:hypothetical protein